MSNDCLYLKSKCSVLLLIKFECLNLDYLIYKEKNKLGFIWSYIVKVIKFLVLEYLSLPRISSCNLKSYFCRDHYAFLKNRCFGGYFHLYLRL